MGMICMLETKNWDCNKKDASLLFKLSARMGCPDGQFNYAISLIKDKQGIRSFLTIIISIWYWTRILLVIVDLHTLYYFKY